MGKPRLSKYEKETIILTSEGDDTYEIYTFNASLKKRLALFSARYPELCQLLEKTAEGSVTYRLEKSRLSLRLQPPYSEERRRASSQWGKEHGIHTQNGGKA